jgi:transcriptional regulator with GAF, ATPase, and Fis domain
LNVFPIQVPPLRERGNDMLLLAETFLEKHVLRHGLKKLSLNEKDKQQILKYAWPGNVRELQNITERFVITGNREIFDTLVGMSIEQAVKPEEDQQEKILTSQELQKLEINNLRNALEKTGGKIFGENGAASLVGIPPTTFCSKLKKYGIPNK